MTFLSEPLPPELLSEAKAFSAFRGHCKSWLQQRGLCYDKFTVVPHDSLIGFISERLICAYLQSLFPDAVLCVWEEAFDMGYIKSLLAATEADAEAVGYVQQYFYDRWDIAITKDEKTIYADVKTALTRKEPRQDWTFLYPVVQAEKPGKDLAILAYYIAQADSENTDDFQRLGIAGFATEKSIRQCPVIPANTRTTHNTLSKIDNYETELSKHYRPLNRLFG